MKRHHIPLIASILFFIAWIIACLNYGFKDFTIHTILALSGGLLLAWWTNPEKN